MDSSRSNASTIGRLTLRGVGSYPNRRSAAYAVSAFSKYIRRVDSLTPSILSDHAFALFVHHRARVGTVSSEPAQEPFRLKDSPLDPNSTMDRVRRDGGREDDVRAPALEIGVPRAIPVATEVVERVLP